MKVISGVSILLLAAGVTGCESSDDTTDPVVSQPVDDVAALNIVSRFDVDDDGWLIEGDAQGGSASPTHEPALADASAHITADDNATGGTWYFSAPSKFTGDLIDFYAGTLAFELKTTSIARPLEEPDVILNSGELEISTGIPMPPEMLFTPYSLPLTEANWVDADGESIDVNTFTAVLMNLERLRIRGEYNIGADSGGLDNVVLSIAGQ